MQGTDRLQTPSGDDAAQFQHLLRWIPYVRYATPPALTKVKMPNPKIPVALVDVPSLSVQSVTGSHSNAVNVLTRLLIAKGMNPADILVICLYRDQKFRCENILQGTGVAVGTVDSAQGEEQSVVILCTTRTHLQPTKKTSFFSDAKRLNVALSRARDGMFIIGSLTSSQTVPDAPFSV
ncbi:hypothetical protein Y032_0082g1595 [Ancylostoma ceylanicum]|uniref:DNA2/NAM7 helicase-like C-terminal domain-containing protein n=1 Tax=Ancylostoma ceylanicum TaxID=53326 RepID=A0A016TS34_9BILA|nr:hypothetical protein Y032_0082g1595 [Ancylostoma ceylanicum]